MNPQLGTPPRGYNPTEVTEPPVVDHSADEAAARTDAISAVATDLTMLRMESDAGRLDRDRLDRILARSAATLRRVVGVTAVLALLVVGAVALPSGRAQAAVAPSGKTWTSAPAMEGPSPDPITVSVTLAAGPVRVAVPVTAATADSHGRHWASIWGPTSYGRGFVGRAWSYSTRFVVPVTLDSRFVPVGRSTMAVTDDVDPLGTYPQVVNLIAKRPSKFGAGTWAPTQYGDGLTVFASLYAFTPARGIWTPQQNSPVAVQELRAGRWVTVATGTTNSRGVFLITVIVGGGHHVLRVHRDAGATVAATNGTARPFDLCPTDVPDGII